MGKDSLQRPLVSFKLPQRSGNDTTVLGLAPHSVQLLRTLRDKPLQGPHSFGMQVQSPLRLGGGWEHRPSMG
ncbi:hypothetical protein [Streptomyces sp. NPDC003015]